VKSLRDRFSDRCVHLADANRLALGNFDDSSEFLKGNPMAFQNDASTSFKQEIDAVAGLQSEPPSHGLRDCDLTFTRECCRSHIVLTYGKAEIDIVANAPAMCARQSRTRRP
jgi:hypothetical protein